MTYKAFGFNWIVNAWRWTLHRHAGRRLWCGRATTGGTLTRAQERELDKLNDGTMEGYNRYLIRRSDLAKDHGKPVVECDDTDPPEFEGEAVKAWNAAPESVRFRALREAFQIQAGPPGLMPHHDCDTLAFRQVNTLYPPEDWRPEGVTDTWESDETADALRFFDHTMGALLAACQAWAEGNRVRLSDWQTILQAAPTIQYTGAPENPPSPDDSTGLEFAHKSAALQQANHWPTIIREAAKAACASFLTFLLFSRAGESWGFNARLRQCQHPGCRDFFVADKRTKRCMFHTTSKGRGKGKAGSDHKVRQRRKTEWGETKDDQQARADLLARWHNSKGGNQTIQDWLRRRFARGVTAVTCSYDTYLKHRADLP